MGTLHTGAIYWLHNVHLESYDWFFFSSHESRFIIIDGKNITCIRVQLFMKSCIARIYYFDVKYRWKSIVFLSWIAGNNRRFIRTRPNLDSRIATPSVRLEGSFVKRNFGAIWISRIYDNVLLTPAHIRTFSRATCVPVDPVIKRSTAF